MSMKTMRSMTPDMRKRTVAMKKNIFRDTERRRAGASLGGSGEVRKWSMSCFSKER